MKNYTTLFFFLLSFQIFAQCSFVDIEIVDQAIIDNFLEEEPNCTEIMGNVKITGANIVSLRGLSQIKSISGRLEITHTKIKDLSGLENLESLDILFVLDNSELESIDELNNKISIESSIGFFSNESLISVDRLADLNNFSGTLNLSAALQELPLFEKLDTLEGLTLAGLRMNDVSGFDSLKYVNDKLSISSNSLLKDISGFANLKNVGALEINSNPLLDEISGFVNLNNVGELNINDNDGLINLKGLDSLVVIEESLIINGNENLTNLDAFISLNIIGENLIINQNENLTNLDSFKNVGSISGKLEIQECPSLTSIEGLAQINSEGISELNIISNPKLSICHIESVCDALKRSNLRASIRDNALGCTSYAEVKEQCVSTGTNESQLNDFRIFPNPAASRLAIEGSPYEGISIYTIEGKQVLQRHASDQIIDISNLANGLYIIKIYNGPKVSCLRFIKSI